MGDAKGTPWRSGFQRWQEKSRSESTLRAVRGTRSSFKLGASPAENWQPHRRPVCQTHEALHSEDPSNEEVWEEGQYSRCIQWQPAAQSMTIASASTAVLQSQVKPGTVASRQKLRAVKHKMQLEEIVANPHDVLFTNPAISDHFSCDRSVASTIASLTAGDICVADIPKIAVVQRDGKLLTLNHRRLYAFRKALARDALVPMRLLLPESEKLLVQSLPRVPACRTTVHVERVQEQPAPPTSSPGIAFCT
eukprot:TRINITY_DN64136_c0_g1_i1.p1 TRINITY_DN64136_c0_g1~~TRINITY_DN64136_c0_g1_i1.p1  ORF type:complete len:250 (-),score=43.53 TRINITY_DN64136_c0_g1_i1:165-914(-)